MAHTSLGVPDASVNIRNREPNHTPGPLGWVFPGGALIGEGARRGFPSYEDPKALIATAGIYSPGGAILASTDDRDNVGDLILALNFNQIGLTSQERAAIASIFNNNDGAPSQLHRSGLKNLRYRSWIIYVPPEFKPPFAWERGENGNIVSSVTDDYTQMRVYKADQKDPFGPSWWVIHITTREDVLVFPIVDSAGTLEDRWHFVRLNGMVAPKIAGRYFFKMFLNATYPPPVTGKTVVDPTGLTPRMKSVPPENWPALLVKGEVDPAVITGTLRHGGLQNQTVAGQPMRLPGVVIAEGVAIDPVTERPTGRRVSAWAFLNATAQGRYEIEGVPAGTYTITATAAGYLPATVSGITVRRGQSLSGVDFTLQPGPVLAGKVNSKLIGDPGVSVNWPSQGLLEDKSVPTNLNRARQRALIQESDGSFTEISSDPILGRVFRPISVELLDFNGALVSFSPINVTNVPYTSYTWDNQTLRYQRVAFPWEGVLSPTKDPFGVHNGVGPAQVWWVRPDSTTFTFQFGNLPGTGFSGAFGVYGAPAIYDGHVPQVFATWVSGLRPGTYTIRIWVNGYIQTQNYQLSVSGGAASGVGLRELDLFQTSFFNLNIRFHDFAGTATTTPIGGPDPGRYVIVEAFNSKGQLRGFNYTFAQANATTITMEVNGFGMAGPDTYGFIVPRPSAPDFSLGQFFYPTFPARKSPLPFMRHFPFRYVGERDYGLPPDTYTLRIFVRGFTQGSQAVGNVGLSTSLPSNINVAMVRGAAVSLTINSKNFQAPPQSISWRHGDTFFPDFQNAVPLGTQVPVDLAAEIYPLLFLIRDDGTKVLAGDVRQFTADDGQWVSPTQVAGQTRWPFLGIPRPTRTVAGLTATTSLADFDGSWAGEYFGPDAGVFWARRPPTVNGMRGGFALGDERIGLSSFFTASAFGGFLAEEGVRLNLASNFPTSLETGLYEVRTFTYGYVQREENVFRASLTKGGGFAQISQDVIAGGGVRAIATFKTENIFTAVTSDMFLRLRVRDRNGNVVAEETSGTVEGGRMNIGGIRFGSIRSGAGTKQVITFGTWWVKDPANEKFFLAGGIDEGTYTVSLEVYFISRLNPSLPTFPPAILMGDPWYGTRVNGFGPFEIAGSVEATVGRSDVITVVFQLDRLATVRGTALAFNLQGDLRPLSWSQVKVLSSASTTFYTYDGGFEFFVPPGDYSLSLVEWSPAGEGHSPKNVSISASPGSDTLLNFQLPQSQVPLPEFPSTFMLLAALALSTILVRHLKKQSG